MLLYVAVKHVNYGNHGNLIFTSNSLNTIKPNPISDSITLHYDHPPTAEGTQHLLKPSPSVLLKSSMLNTLISPEPCKIDLESHCLSQSAVSPGNTWPLPTNHPSTGYSIIPHAGGQGAGIGLLYEHVASRVSLHLIGCWLLSSDFASLQLLSP